MSTHNSSKIFAPFRALGFISNHVPLCVRYHQRHKENYIVTCVGKAFHTYRSSGLGITSVSNAHPDEIDSLAVDGRYVFTSCGKTIRAFTRGREVVHTYEGHLHPVILLLPFGPHLVSVDRSSRVCVWDVEAEDVYLELPFEGATFQVTAMTHPNTYLNKMLFGSKQGELQLWNLHTNKLIFTFPGWGSPVTVLEQAPAIDVVAVGLEDGRVTLLNIRYNEEIMTLKQDWGPITAISFRTDGHPVMATGSTLGHVALWNLEEQKLQSQMRNAHVGAVTGMRCLPSEPLLVTSSPDNSLKVWIFDMPDGGGRLLRERSGHSAPPTLTRFHGDSGQDILSAGQDSVLRSFSTVHDSRNKSLGRAWRNKVKGKRKKDERYLLPPITYLASESSRQSDWASIAACHRCERAITTWDFNRSTMADHRLVHDRFAKDKALSGASALCVDVTSCGNFAAIGYSSGHVDLFNMQSGLHRRAYGNPTAHVGAVRGIAVDGLNQLVITGAADSTLRFWKFKSGQPLESLKLTSPVARLVLHRQSCLLAVALDDFTAVLVDTDTRKVVRTFTGHKGLITDMGLSADSRWLITASMDSTVRVWDLPTGRLVDCFLVDSAVTSVAMSPTGDFLVTSHVDDLGLYLWSNMTLYSHVALRPLPADYEPQLMELPSSSRKSRGVAGEDDEMESEGHEEADAYKSPEQISDELVTLSMLPNSRWLSLLSLDVIKMRNKPKEPPKVPKSAPFFLPTVAGLEPKFAAPEAEDAEDKGASHVLTTRLQPLTEFGKCLTAADKSQQYDEVMTFLRALGPSGVERELRALSPDGGGSAQLMTYFLRSVGHALRTNKDFELTQAYLGLFIKLHGDVVSADKGLTAALEDLQEAQGETWRRLQTLFNQSLCVVNYLKSAAL